MSDVRTTLLFTVKFLTAPPQMLGKTPIGDRRIVVVTGGSFEGPKLRGTVEPGGTDWILLRPDGALQLDVRLCLKTDDGALIGMTYRGYRHGPPAVIERLNRGDTVDPSDYYFRTAPFFETSAPRYDWLNRIVCVGIGHRLPEGPVYRVFEVL
ncbi:MAG TPA: DUF3237 domain-containing protein [Stellaceae bacterium]|nr:DUF3237 domain-containing protein [Stellaceae bacterium]